MRKRKFLLIEKQVGSVTYRKANNTNRVLLYRDIGKTQSDIRAFTLLELIIAISIGTALILLVSFSIRTGSFQMEKGSKWLEERYRDNSALFFFHQQATSMRSELHNKKIIFDGDSDRIVFVTPISLNEGYGLGLMLVNYYIEEGNEGFSLNYQEKRFVPSENLSAFKDQNVLMFSDSDVVGIVKGYEEISFKYLGMQEDVDATSGKSVLEWKDEWLGNSLPKAVKVALTKEGKNQEQIAPVMAMY